MEAVRICARIYTYASDNCDGCQNISESFMNHSCYTTPWSWHVLNYYQLVIQELNFISDDNLLQAILNHGPSYDFVG